MNGFILLITVLLLQAVNYSGKWKYWPIFVNTFKPSESSEIQAEESEAENHLGQEVGECPEVDGMYLTILAHKCNGSTPVVYKCPFPLHFNPTSLMCDYPDKAGCGEDGYEGEPTESNEIPIEASKEENHLGQEVGECPEVDGEYITVLPHKSDCTRFFVCNGGTPVAFQCPFSLHFNPTSLMCDPPDQAVCGEDGYEGEPGESNEIPIEVLKEENHIGQEIGECPEVDGVYVTILAHKSDCTRFFMCDRGTPVVRKCSSGLHFNPSLLVCDYPDKAGCGEDGHEGEAAESSEIPIEASKEENHLGQEVGECPEVDGVYVTILAHKSDCARFFICDRGTPIVRKCSFGLYFNPTLLVCDYPDKAGCGEDGHEGEAAKSSEIPIDASKEENHLGQEVGECPEVDGEYITVLPHKSDCTRFFVCIEGTPVVKTCYPGLHFNPTLLVCDYPDKAGCGKDGHEEEPAESSEIPREESEEDHLGQEVGECPEDDGVHVTILAHRSDCTRFFVCNGSTPVVYKCPLGLLFNPTLLACDYPDKAGCGEDGHEGEPTESSEIPTEESEAEDHLGQEVGECPEVDGVYATTLAHKSDCTRFFVCNRGTPLVFKCAFGLHFNPTSLICDYPEKAGCGEDGHDGEPAESSEIPTEESEEQNHLGQEVGECPEVDGEYITVLPHKSDCTRFFVCIEGTPVVKTCYPGLHFNPTLLVCDYPDKAGCGKDGHEGEPAESSEIPREESEEGHLGQEVGECPEDDGVHVTILEHRSDCTRFFVCNGSTPVVYKCPFGLLFNPTLLACDHPDKAGCGEDGHEGEPAESSEMPREESEEDHLGQEVGECPEDDVTKI